MTQRPEATAPPPADLPSDSRRILAVLLETLERWSPRAAEVADWPGAAALVPPRHGDWAGLVERLQLINAFQWREEDRSREPDADDHLLAAVKRSIDASNRRRVRTVEALDALLHARFADAGLLRPDAPLHSESPGSIVDRLSVLALKIHHLGEAASGPEADAGTAERLRGLREQLDDLAGCLDRLLADLAAGRARFKLYRQVKVYRDPRSGRLLPEPDPAADA